MTQDQATQLRAIAGCCLCRAVMLEFADRDRPSINKLNCGQAGYLRDAAKMALALADAGAAA